MKLSRFIVFSILFILKSSVILANEESWLAKFESEKNYVENVCQQLENVQYPHSDIHSAKQKAQLNKCNARDLYYGIGQEIDYTKARLCAFITPADEDLFAYGVLMMAYANGLDVKRNYTLAKKAACQLGGAPAEIHGRLVHLSELESSKLNAKQNFDICDDITSGYMQGVCSLTQFDLEDQNREKKLSQITQNWNIQEKSAFNNLRIAAAKYFDLTSDHEVDQSGTGRVAFSLAVNLTQKNGFLKHIESFEAGIFPKYTKTDFIKADRELNRLYSKLIRMPEPEFSTINLDGIKKVQRSWLTYRDTWVVFNKIKYPTNSDHALKTFLTKQRSAMLKDLIDDLS